MARASLGITTTIASILISTMIAGCGGGSGDSTPTGTTQTSTSGSSGSTGTLASSGGSSDTAAGNNTSNTVTASGQTTTSLEQLPYVDPAPLEDLMRLSDADYQNQLDNNWNYVSSLLDRYVPPDVTLYPVPRGFYGPMTSCKQYHGLVACREHMTQLIGLMRSKAPGG